MYVIGRLIQLLEFIYFKKYFFVFFFKDYQLIFNLSIPEKLLLVYAWSRFQNYFLYIKKCNISNYWNTISVTTQNHLCIYILIKVWLNTLILLYVLLNCLVIWSKWYLFWDEKKYVLAEFWLPEDCIQPIRRFLEGWPKINILQA